MRKVKAKWAARQRGIQLEDIDSPRLTNLRIVGDIRLTDNSLSEAKPMILYIIEDREKVGLELHPENRKLQIAVVPKPIQHS